jgi:hypothetical protein
MAKRNGGKRRNGDRKHGRQKRKSAGKGNPVSLYARGKITAEHYFKITNQSLKNKG